MKKMTKTITLLVSALLCVSLVSCGETDSYDDTDYMEAGDDWRTTGLVLADGVITRDGESTEVLVTVGDNGAAFYYDDAGHVIFDEVEYPETIAGAHDKFESISFDDIDGDGESDVVLTLTGENGDSIELVWIWSAEDGYVYRDSTAPDVGEYVELWGYVGQNLWLRIHEDATWEFVNLNDEVIDNGTLWVDENGVTLHFDGNGDVLQLDRTVSGDLIDMANGGSLVPVDEIQSSEPYFVRNGLEINAEVDGGEFYLDNGFCTYFEGGADYSRTESYWEIKTTSNTVTNGVREINFDAICRVPSGAISSYEEGCATEVSCELFDYYTGMWLTDTNEFANSSRGDDYYLHTVSYGGSSSLIEFSYITEYEYEVGDFALVVTRSYTVYVPEDYDGLVFAAETQPETYEGYDNRMLRYTNSPEAALLDLEETDSANMLFFRFYNN